MDSFWCSIQSTWLSPTQLSSRGWLDFYSSCSTSLLTTCNSFCNWMFFIRELRLLSSLILAYCCSSACFIISMFFYGLSSGSVTISSNYNIMIFSDFFKFWIIYAGTSGVSEINGLRNERAFYLFVVLLGCFLIFPMSLDKIIKILNWFVIINKSLFLISRNCYWCMQNYNSSIEFKILKFEFE